MRSFIAFEDDGDACNEERREEFSLLTCPTSKLGWGQGRAVDDDDDEKEDEDEGMDGKITEDRGGKDGENDGFDVGSKGGSGGIGRQVRGRQRGGGRTRTAAVAPAGKRMRKKGRGGATALAPIIQTRIPK